MVHISLHSDPSGPPIHTSTLPTLVEASPMLSPFALLYHTVRTPRTTISLKMLDSVVLAPHRRPNELVKQVQVWVGREDLWRSLDPTLKKGREVSTFGGKVRFVGKLSGVRSVLALLVLIVVASADASLSPSASPAEPSSTTIRSSLF